jgi:hypothetical protein
MNSYHFSDGSRTEIKITEKPKMQHTGTVRSILTKDYNNQKLYSFGLEEKDGPLYGLGRVTPIFKEGDEIEFGFILNAKGYPTVKGESVVVTKAGTAAKPASKAWSGEKKSAEEKGYWELREAREVETQKRISYQAAKNTALASVTSMATLGLLKFGTKKGVVVDNFLQCVDKLTLRYFAEYQAAPSVSIKPPQTDSSPDSEPDDVENIRDGDVDSDDYDDNPF